MRLDPYRLFKNCELSKTKKTEKKKTKNKTYTMHVSFLEGDGVTFNMVLEETIDLVTNGHSIRKMLQYIVYFLLRYTPLYSP